MRYNEPHTPSDVMHLKRPDAPQFSECGEWIAGKVEGTFLLTEARCRFCLNGVERLYQLAVLAEHRRAPVKERA